MKIILCGACGQMGRNVTALTDGVLCGVDLYPAQSPFPVYRSFSEIPEAAVKEADAVIDFSSAVNVRERLDFAIKYGLPIVLASTGYTEEDLRLINECAKKIPVFRTGNFSLGINLLCRLVKKAASVLEGFDIEIVERHHNRKKDAPSGTALMLADAAKDGKEQPYKLGRAGICPRERGEIGIHAVRGGTIVGEHEVMFAGEDEIVTLSHSARSRKVFASGALKAAEWLTRKGAGLYDMDDFFGDLLGEI